MRLALPVGLALMTYQALGIPLQAEKRQASTSIPQYVLDYAPLVWLDPGEAYFPSDISAQLANTHPTLNRVSIANAPSPLTLSNLNQLNALGGANVYLTSNTDWTTSPPYTLGIRPDYSGVTPSGTTAAIIIHQHSNDPTTLDAFYHYFYAYNQGNTVLFPGNELGDHLGDWEYSMVRFDTTTGLPKSVWLSQHAAGAAFAYSALEKSSNNPSRAVIYSARGTHANYATSGGHDHTIPGLPLEYGLLEDHTGQGTLWDPVQAAYFYSVSYPASAGPDDSSNPTFVSLDGSPVEWLYFLGHWGDDQLPDNDPRQRDFLGARKYTGGPTGPEDKKLNRKDVCPKGALALCIINEVLLPGS